jgi:hypothetical protein
MIAISTPSFSAAARAATLGAALLFSMLPGPCLAQATPPSAPAALTAQVELIERLSESHLKVLVLRCSSESTMRVLPSAEAAFCSIAWESLKKRSFSGDSDAMLAWWQAHRDDVIDEVSAAANAARQN